jgi:ABC-type branched-subunit amino acid transport system ATPase component
MPDLLKPELLSIESLRAGYGEAVVLPNMSFSLGEGQVLALLGRNGTGKTTLINSRACARTSGRAPASAGCRRSATSSVR